MDDGGEVVRTRRLVLTVSTMLSTLLYTIDTTVANVALPVLRSEEQHV